MRRRGDVRTQLHMSCVSCVASPPTPPPVPFQRSPNPPVLGQVSRQLPAAVPLGRTYCSVASPLQQKHGHRPSFSESSGGWCTAGPLSARLTRRLRLVLRQSNAVHHGASSSEGGAVGFGYRGLQGGHRQVYLRRGRQACGRWAGSMYYSV